MARTSTALLLLALVAGCLAPARLALAQGSVGAAQGGPASGSGVFPNGNIGDCQTSGNKDDSGNAGCLNRGSGNVGNANVGDGNIGSFNCYINGYTGFCQGGEQANQPGGPTNGGTPTLFCGSGSLDQLRNTCPFLQAYNFCRTYPLADDCTNQDKLNQYGAAMRQNIANAIAAAGGSTTTTAMPATTTTTMRPAGTARGDPHFVGFDGSNFGFHGAKDAAFNVISTPNTQLNALLLEPVEHAFFPDMLMMKAIGLKHFRDHVAVRVERDEAGWMLTVEANGEKIAPGTTLAMADGTLLSFAPRQMAFNKSMEVTMRAGGWAIRAELPANAEDAARAQWEDRIDLAVDLVGAPAMPCHGVLGQTYSKLVAGQKAPVCFGRHCEKPFEQVHEGAEADYFVSDLFADDFAFNKFGMPEAAPASFFQRLAGQVLSYFAPSKADLVLSGAVNRRRLAETAVRACASAVEGAC